jgi:hypothetical protein
MPLFPFALACEADAKGHTGLEHQTYPQSAYLLKAANALSSVDNTAVLKMGLQGAEIGAAIRLLRIQAVAAAMPATKSV